MVRPRAASTPIANAEFLVGQTTPLLEIEANATNGIRPRGEDRTKRKPKKYF